MFERFGTDADLVFVPHLLPVARGILATVTIPLAEPIADPLGFWRAHYADEPFIELQRIAAGTAGRRAPQRGAHSRSRRRRACGGRRWW